MTEIALGELFAQRLGTGRVVPVAILLHPGRLAPSLMLRSEHKAYLDFRYLACPFVRFSARQHPSSNNLLARLKLPNMAHAPEDKVEVYAQAVRGLLELEPHPGRRENCFDFIDIDVDLNDNK